MVLVQTMMLFVLSIYISSFMYVFSVYLSIYSTLLFIKPLLWQLTIAPCHFTGRRTHAQDEG